MPNDVSIERVIQDLTVLRDFWDIAKGDKLTIRFNSDELKEEFKKEMDTAIKAVEKQIPQKPLVVSYETSYSHHCPDCTEKIDSFNIGFMQDGEQFVCFGGEKYCSKCGQRLRWTND